MFTNRLKCFHPFITLRHHKKTTSRSSVISLLKIHSVNDDVIFSLPPSGGVRGGDGAASHKSRDRPRELETLEKFIWRKTRLIFVICSLFLGRERMFLIIRARRPSGVRRSRYRMIDRLRKKREEEKPFQGGDPEEEENPR